MRPILYYLKHPKDTAVFAFMKIAPFLPDSLHLRILYRIEMGKRLNLSNPVTFCEKLQWLKLYNRKPEYTKMVDKLAAKEYVASIIGNEYIIPVLGVWNNPEEIDFDSLPVQFVLKTSHGGGGNGVIICKDKSKLDINGTRKKLKELMKQDIYRSRVEWPYKDVPKRIFAEKFMVDESGNELKDYKLLNFGGEPLYIEVDSGRFTDHIRNIYNTQWEFQNIAIVYRNDLGVHFEKPKELKKMVDLARVLSKGLPFLRTDFYVINDKIYFGELTFFQRSGFTSFTPSSVDLALGNRIVLPVKTTQK